MIIKYPVFFVALALSSTLLLTACGQKGPLYHDNSHYDLAEEYYYAFPGYYYPYAPYEECPGHHCHAYREYNESHEGHREHEGGERHERHEGHEEHESHESSHGGGHH